MYTPSSSLAAALVLLLTASSNAQLIGLGHLNPADRTNATGISADGNYVIGFSEAGGAPAQTPLRWSISGAASLQQLPFPAGWSAALPTDVSADGHTVVGWRQQLLEFPPFRWIQGVGSTALTTPAAWTQVRGRSVSADGSTAAGWAAVSGLGTRVVRWVGNSPGETIPLPAGYNYSIGGAFDGTGRIYGTARQTNNTYHLVRWVGDAMENLTPLPVSGNMLPAPVHVSADGSVIAGQTGDFTVSPIREDGWVWSLADGMTVLPLLPGMYTSAITDISADGRMVLGMNYATSSTIQAPFIWTRDRGTIPLSQFLSESGVDLTGWSLLNANGISADGTKIVGTGIGSSGRIQAFVAIIPSPATTLPVMTAVLLATSRRRRRH
ncbi:MAG: hypothetical protein KF699_07255 [Phycisphaeraceae bacterium]|nr:hypothetical protein [Phycisphaeraceae bacterium]MBX3405152.1 hypothetical protein [Phycisphaeraceae bacterium]